MNIKKEQWKMIETPKIMKYMENIKVLDRPNLICKMTLTKMILWK